MLGSADDLDGVALGLRRSPRGLVVAVVCVGVVVAVVALKDFVHFERSTGPVTVDAPPPPPPSMPVTPAIAPGPKRLSRVKPTRATKVTPAVVPSAPSAVAVEAPPVVEAPAAVSTPAPAPVVVEEAVAPPPPPPAEEPAVEPEPVAAAAVEPETVAPDGNGAAIARLIADQKRAAVRACFESELKATPKLRGTVVVELDLAPPNKVGAVRVNDDLERPEFTRCVRATMESVKFGALDEEVSVSVPYVLVPGKK